MKDKRPPSPGEETQKPPQSAMALLADNLADESKPLSLWPLTMDQAVRIAVSAPPVPKREKTPK